MIPSDGLPKKKEEGRIKRKDVSFENMAKLL